MQDQLQLRSCELFQSLWAVKFIPEVTSVFVKFRTSETDCRFRKSKTEATSERGTVHTTGPPANVVFILRLFHLTLLASVSLTGAVRVDVRSVVGREPEAVAVSSEPRQISK